MSATAAPPIRMSGDEFLRQYGDQSGFELVEGQLVRLPMPGLLHGEVCVNAGSILREFVKANKLGRICGNDSLVRTRTDPDGFRGADLLFLSYETLPVHQSTPVGSITPPVDLVVEVKSPSNSFTELSDKATEYLKAGVKVVLVLDPETESAGVYRGNEFPHRFHNGDELTLSDILPGFAVPVKKFFE